MSRNELMSLALFLGACAMASGCNKKDAEACQRAQSTVRQALSTGNFEGARTWREYGYKHCEASEMSSLDQEIVAKETAVQQEKAAAAAKKAKVKNLVSLLANFAGGAKDAPNKAAKAAKCDGDDEKPKPKEGWCRGTRSVNGGNTSFQVTYRKEEPKAFKVKANIGDEFTCDDLGPNTVKRQWTHLKRKRVHCALNGGAAAGLHALTSNAGPEHWVILFSPEYLEKDPGMKKKVTSEGS